MLANTNRRGLRNHLVFVPIVLALSFVAAACSGVSDEELEAVQQDLQAQIEMSQSLESQLAQDRANAASLQAIIDEAEVLIAGMEAERESALAMEADLAAMKAQLKELQEFGAEAEVQKVELERQMAQEEAQIAQLSTDMASLQEIVERSDVQDALLAVFLAWNRKDVSTFLAGVTDEGLKELLGSPSVEAAELKQALPELIGEPPIVIRRVRDTTVSGDTATIHAMFATGKQRNSVLESLVKEDGLWKIDGEQVISPKIKGDTTAIDVQLDEFAFVFATDAITGGNVAFRVENVGEQPHHLVLWKVPQDLDVLTAVQSEEEPVGVEEIAATDPLEPGEQIDVAFTDPLDPGRYVLLCFLPDLDDPELLPHVLKGMVREFAIP